MNFVAHSLPLPHQVQGAVVDRDLKVILLGNGRVGKTSLVKRLVANDFDPHEVSTHGIQMTTWEPGWEETAPHLTIGFFLSNHNCFFDVIRG